MLYIEDKLHKLCEYFKSQHNILAVWIVGSYGTIYQREDSDIDFAILFSSNISIMEEMQVATDISLILNFENVDTIDLLKAPMTLKFKTIKEGRNIYEADKIKVCDFIENVIRRYPDEKYYYDRFLEDFKESYK